MFDHSLAFRVAPQSDVVHITYNRTNTIALNGVAPQQLTADHFIFS